MNTTTPSIKVLPDADPESQQHWHYFWWGAPGASGLGLVALSERPTAPNEVIREVLPPCVTFASLHSIGGFYVGFMTRKEAHLEANKENGVSRCWAMNAKL